MKERLFTSGRQGRKIGTKRHRSCWLQRIDGKLLRMALLRLEGGKRERCGEDVGCRKGKNRDDDSA